MNEEQNSQPSVDGDNPTLPEVQNTPISQPPKKKKSKRQIIIVLLTAVFLLVAAGLWYFFVYNKTTEEAAAPAEQAVTTIPEGEAPKHFIQHGNKVSYINSEGKLNEIATLDDTEELVEVVEINDKIELRYVTKQSTGQDISNPVAYGKIDSNGKTELVKLPADTNSFYSNPILSPDGSTIVVEKSDPTTGAMIELTAINLSDGSAKKVYDPSTRGGLYVMVDWAEKGTLLLQSQSCRECDGPRLAELTKLSLLDGKMTSFYKADSSKIEYAEFMRMPGSEDILMFGGDFSLIFENDPNSDYDPYYGYHINKITGTATRNIEIQEDEYASLVGWTSDTTGLYITHTGQVKTDAADADYQSIDGNYNNLPPMLWLTKGGSKSDVAFESDKIIKNTQITKVFEDKYGLYILQEDGTKDADANGDGMRDTVYRLLRKSSSTGTVESLIEHTGEYNDVTVFDTAIIQ